MEWCTRKSVNYALLLRRRTHVLTPGGGREYVVHPRSASAMIAVGEWLFGLTPLGWRFSVAVVGSLAILLTAGSSGG